MFYRGNHILNKRSLFKGLAVLLTGLLAAPALMAKGAVDVPRESSMGEPMVITLLIIVFVLLLAIVLLANVVLGAAGYFSEKRKEDKAAEEAGGISKAATTAIVTGLLLFSAPLFAQDADVVVQAAPQTIGGIAPTAFYFLIGVIFAELLVVFVLLYNLRTLLVQEKVRKAAAQGEEAVVAKPKFSWKKFWNNANRFRPLEQESQIELDHNYDGIRELDNRLPPWWLYGFYASIIFAGIYLWRYHVSHSAPLSKEELQIAMQQAEKEHEAYLAKAADLVDETNVTLLTDNADITAGKKVFLDNCKTCHGEFAQGLVGPNLTDDYWLHGGGIKEVFKTVKYGWPDKGMRSWKDDLSPAQIAQVASYVKSLHDSNPPGALPPQGELYKEATASPAVDSASATPVESATEKTE